MSAGVLKPCMECGEEVECSGVSDRVMCSSCGFRIVRPMIADMRGHAAVMHSAAKRMNRLREVRQVRSPATGGVGGRDVQRLSPRTPASRPPLCKAGELGACIRPAGHPGTHTNTPQSCGHEDCMDADGHIDACRWGP